MKTLLKWMLRIIAVLIVIALIVGLWKKEEIARLLAVNSLFSADKIVHNFSHMDAAFLTQPILGGNTVSPLPLGSQTGLPDIVEDWITERSVTSLVVLKNGEIVAEDYFQGTQPDDLRINWSVSKSYLSALMGILLDQGAIDSIDDPVTKYATSLRGSAYDGASIKNVLQMSSGITFNEDYLDQSSDINRMGRVLALGRSMDGFTEDLTATEAAPGERWQYVSIDTHVIGMVIRGATGRPIVDLMSEHVIGPLGMERDPFILTDGYEVAFVLGGMNTTTRDNARFGQMIAQGGEWNGVQIVPSDWIDASTVASAKTAPDEFGYGYQWWMPPGGEPGQFMARGIYGQYIFIDRPRDVVIATHGADRQFRSEGASEQNIAVFTEIAESLD